MALKDRIYEAMKAAKLSPADLARATKSTNAAVTFWLSGQTKSLKAGLTPTIYFKNIV